MAASLRHHQAALGIKVELVVMGNVFIADTTRDAPIGATPEPTPAIIRGWIFRVNHAIDPSGATEEAARNAKDDFAILDVCLKVVGLRSLAPSPPLPLADEAVDPPGSYFRRQKQIAFERKEHGRAFGMLDEGQNGGAHLPMSPQRQIDAEDVLAGSWGTIVEKEIARRARNRYQDVVGASDCFVAQAASLSRRAGGSTSQISFTVSVVARLRSHSDLFFYAQDLRPDEISRGREMIRDRDLVRPAWGDHTRSSKGEYDFCPTKFPKICDFLCFLPTGGRPRSEEEEMRRNARGGT